ncbi:MAG: DUF4034 domain-containing protein [Candidatus Hydrogenedentes bacterium]|nr:DUF4034 domain-containing protein [Candidatus Hydrogenedentota bacterium]
MEREDVVASIIGVLVAVCMGLLALGPVVYVYKNGFAAIRPGKEDGAKNWAEDSAADLKREADVERQITELGLRQRYTVVPFFEGSRQTLYTLRDFATVEARLAAQFAKSDQYERFNYGRCIGDLCDIRAGDDPKAMEGVLNEWVVAYPNSYRARLVRGRFHVDYAWVYRGGSLARDVSASSFEGFHRHLELAEADLTAARDMEPSDPNASVSMISIAMGRGEPDARVMDHYSKAIAVDPLNFMARLRLLTARLPQWGGSWEEVDAIMAESARSSAAFPMLGLMEREGARLMRTRSEKHKDALDSEDVKRRWVEPYLAQLKVSPGAPLLETNAAFYAAEGGDYALAETYFRKLGDTYYEGNGSFEHVLEYNNYRGYVYAFMANAMAPGDERSVRIKEALDLAPNHYYTNYIYGMELFDKGDHAGSKPYMEKSRDVYPGYVWSTCRLAEIAEKAGQRDEAVRLARAVFDLEPEQIQMDHAQAIIDRNR